MTGQADPALVDGVGVGVVPTQRRGVEVRDRLLEAAIAEFSEQGVEASRVERIVEAAGTGWGTFFRYFPRKQDVYLVEASRQFRQYVKPVYERALTDESIPVEGSLREMFGQLIEARHTPRFHAEMINEAVRHPARLAAIIGEGEVPLATLVTGLLARGQERGEIRGDIPAPLCAMVLTAGVMFSASFGLRAVAEGNLPASEISRVQDQAFGLAWDGLRRTDAAPGSDKTRSVPAP